MSAKKTYLDRLPGSQKSNQFQAATLQAGISMGKSGRGRMTAKNFVADVGVVGAVASKSQSPPSAQISAKVCCCWCRWCCWGLFRAKRMDCRRQFPGASPPVTLGKRPVSSLQLTGTNLTGREDGEGMKGEDDDEEQEDGTLLVSFQAGGELEMAWHLFSWGDCVEVIEPKTLADLIADHRPRWDALP